MKKKLVYLVLLITLCALVLASCTDGDSIIIGDKFSLSYMDGETILKTELLPENSELDLTYTPENVDKVFAGWFYDKDLTLPARIGDLLVAHTVLYAKWDDLRFAVTFRGFNNVVLDRQIVDKGGNAVAPDAPKVLNYEFKGWSGSFENVTENVTVNAIYQKISATVTFKFGDTVLYQDTAEAGDALDVYFNTALAELNAPSGFLFDYWCSDVELNDKITVDGNTVMPETDAVYYVKLKLAPINESDITLSSSLSEYVFGTSPAVLSVGLSESGDNSENGITYSYEWYLSGTKLEGDAQTYNVGVLNVGKYVFKAKITASYADMSSVFAEKQISVEVTRATITGISVTAPDKVYDGKESKITVNGCAESGKIYYKTSDGDYNLENPSLKNVGEYTVYFKIVRENYFDYEFETTLKITPASLTVTVGNFNIKYGDELPAFNYDVVGFADGDDSSVIKGSAKYNCEATGTFNLGNYKIRLIEGCFSADNYIFTYVAGELVIGKATLTVTAENKTATYGNIAPAFTVSYSGFKGSDGVASLEGDPTFDCNYKVGDNAGEYKIAVSGLTAQNYEIDFADGILTVNPKAVILTADAITITYGQSAPEYTAKAEGVYNGDTLNYTVSSLYSAGNKAGSYDIVVAVGENPNYTVTPVNGKLTVNKAKLTVTAENKTATYGNIAPAFTVSYSGFKGSDGVASLEGDPTFDCNYKVGDNAGVYKIAVSRLTAQNYEIDFADGILTVNPKAVTLTADGITITYGQSAPEYTAKAEGVYNGDTLNYTVTSLYSAGNKAGSYDIVIAVGENPNYTVTPVNGKLTVNKATLTVTAEDKTITYGDNAPAFTVSYSGFVLSDSASDLSGTLEYTVLYEKGSIIGNYEVSPYGVTSENYDIDFTNGTLYVQPKTLNVVFNTVKAYDGAVWFTSQLNFSDLIQGDTMSGTLSTSSNEVKLYQCSGDVLSEDFVWRGLSITKGSLNVESCYALIYDLSVEIKVLEIAHSTNNYNGVYDASFHNAYVSTTTGADIKYSVDSIEYAAEPVRFKNVGSYTVYYLLTLEGKTPASGTLIVTITPAPLTIKAEGKTITYGGDLPELTASIEGACDGDTINYELSADYSVGNNTGSYNITVEVGENPNYTVSVVTAQLTVNKANLTVTADNKSAIYGDTAPAFTVSYSGFVLSDNAPDLSGTPAFACNYVAGSKAGTYVIIPSGLSSGNYTINYVNGNLTVTPKPITLIATGKDIVYGEESPVFGVSSDGFVGSDGALDITGLTFATNYTKGMSAGSYEIEILTAENVNYVFTFQKGTLNVGKRAASIIATDAETTFGEGLPTLVAEVIDAYGTDTLNYQLSCSYSVGNNVGRYDITVSESDNTNYEITLTNATLTVNQKRTAVVWSGLDGNYVYNGANQGGSVTAVFDGITADITFSGQDTIFKNAGTYTVTASTTNGNYVLTDTEKTITVKKADYNPDNITVAQLKGTYNPNHTLGANYTITNYTWINPNLNPTVPVKEYAAKYNADPSNYNDLAVMVGLDLTKAIVNLGGVLVQEYICDGAAHGISTDGFTLVLDGVTVTPEHSFVFSRVGDGEANSFTAAGTYRTDVDLVADNYKFGAAYTCYVKIKGVKIGGNYYTVEDALSYSVSGNKIIVAFDTSFADAYNGGCYTEASGDVKSACYTVKAGVTLLLPFEDNDVTGYIGPGDSTTANYTAHPATNGTPVLYRALTLPTGRTLTVNGELIVGAMTGSKGTAYDQNLISGAYAELIVNGDIKAINGTVRCMGYITGDGTLTADNSTVIESLALPGWPGGTFGTGRYTGKYTIPLFGSITIKNPQMFPFSNYKLHSIQIKEIINYGSKLQGYVKIATSEVDAIITKVKAQINEAYLTFITSSEKASDGLLRLTSGASVTKTFVLDETEKNYRTRMLIDGTVNDGYTSMTLIVAIKTATLSTEKVMFPLDGLADIEIADGATLNLNYKYKLMPGARVIVNAGGTLNVNGELCAYDSTFVPVLVQDCSNKGKDAYLQIDGTFNLNGTFGGKIKALANGAVNVGANAILSVMPVEGKGSRDGLTLDILISNQKEMTATFINTDGSTVGAEQGKNYRFVDGAWQVINN